MTQYKLGIDVGGTFTDVVLQSEGSPSLQAKAPSTPGKEADGVLDAIETVAKEAGVSAETLLKNTRVINFGTTVATNAMLQNKGVRVGLITTKGFRDIIELRRGWKEVMFDLKQPPPPILVRRRWRIGVDERMGIDGSVVTPLDDDAVREAAGRFAAAGIRSVAVCFLCSFANAAHERRVQEIIAEVSPETDVYLSSDVLPKIREYERFSTTVVNAYLSPLLKGYLKALTDKLSARGFAGDLFVMQSNGGSVSPDIAGESGCAALLSGPAAGVVAAARIGANCDADNVIGVDMGGTSYDVSLVRNGEPETRAGDWFNRQWVGLPMLGIHTVGAGGGSIAWIDPGGALRIGPQSAGARPGPACYGFGGEDATVTDAFLSLGYLNPQYFLGGRMKLYSEKANQALHRGVAKPLGMDVEEAAFSVLRIVNNNMANAIRYVSVARGLDPRDFVLMSFGGAGSITVGAQARELGISRILVPRTASVLCALGELWTDLKVSQLLPLRALASSVDTADLTRRLNAMADPYLSRFSSINGVDQVTPVRSAELHYEGQSHEIVVPVEAANGTIDAAVWQGMIDRFHQRHQELYAFQLPGKPVEVLSVGQDVIGYRDWSLPERKPSGSSVAEAVKGTRRVCFEVDGAPQWLDTPLYDGARLSPGHAFDGPAIVEEVDTTIVVQPGDRLELNRHDVYQIQVTGAENG